MDRQLGNTDRGDWEPVGQASPVGRASYVNRSQWVSRRVQRTLRPVRRAAAPQLLDDPLLDLVGDCGPCSASGASSGTLMPVLGSLADALSTESIQSSSTTTRRAPRRHPAGGRVSKDGSKRVRCVTNLC
jgi:hypothetical protein